MSVALLKFTLSLLCMLTYDIPSCEVSYSPKEGILSLKNSWEAQLEVQLGESKSRGALNE